MEKNWGSSAPLATLSLCALSWEEGSGVSKLGGVRVGWSGPRALGACPSGQDGALQTQSAWQISLSMSADLREREVWEKHGIF